MNQSYTKKIVAIGICAALYTVISFINIPIAPNTELRPSIAVITIFGAVFGPVVGFLSGFIGNVIADLVKGYGFWPTWDVYTGIIGLFAGLIVFHKSIDISLGKFSLKAKIILLVYGLVGIILGALIAMVGDIEFYGEPYQKMVVQASFAALSNAIVFVVLTLPILTIWAKRNATKSVLKKS